MPYQINTDPGKPAKDASEFVTVVDHSDIKAMQAYEQGIRNETLDMTGRQVHERLSRIEAELARIEAVKEHLIRLKRITKSAVMIGDIVD